MTRQKKQLVNFNRRSLRTHLLVGHTRPLPFYGKLVLGLSLLVLAVPLWADVSSDGQDYVTEKRQDGTILKYHPKDTFYFDGANIDGVYNKPSGSYISSSKAVKGKTLIRVRENFDPEVRDSGRLLR